MAGVKSIAERALCEIERRLKRIRVADGYSTDAGLHVFRARRSLPVEELPALILWDSGETPFRADGSMDAYVLTLRVTVDAHVKADQDCTGREIGETKADVKRAVLSGPKGALADGPPPDSANKIGIIAYAGASVTPREEGSQTESLSMTFDVTFKEGYGNPNSSQLEN